MRAADRKEAGLDLFAAAQDERTCRQVDQFAERLDQRARLTLESVASKRLPAKASSARLNSSVVTCATSSSRATGGFRRSPAFEKHNAYGPSCSINSVNGVDGLFGADQQAIGDEPEGRDVDQASALIDQVDEGRIDVRIFAGPGIALLSPLSSSTRAAVLQTNVEAIAGLDGDRPFLAFAAPPIEADVKRAVRLGAGEGDFGRDRRLRIGRHLQARPTGRTTARERSWWRSRKR